MAANKILNVEPAYVAVAIANILNCAVIPNAPVALAATTIATGGSLAAATYFYKITALSAAGESQASNEVSVTTAGATSSNQISWQPSAGATGYRVYRGTATGVENVYYLPGNVTTFLDIAGANTAGSPPTVGAAVFGNVGFAPTQPYMILKHIRLQNKDVANRTVTLYKGASGGNVGGTEFAFDAVVIAPGSSADWYGQARFDAIDFLTGVCDAASKVTINIEGEIGLS